MHSTIADVLGEKGSEVYSVDVDAMVDLAVGRMAVLHVGALLVLERGAPVGMLSERDILRRLVYRDRCSHETPVSAVMTPDPLAVEPSASVADTMRAMTVHRCRHLPVVEDRRVVGLVSIGDLTHWVTRALESEHSHFPRYVHGQYVSHSALPLEQQANQNDAQDEVPDSAMAL